MFQLSLALLCSRFLLGADVPLPPLPSDFPVEARQQPAVRRVPTPPLPQRQVTLPNFPRQVTPVQAQSYSSAPAVNEVDKALAWDAVLKEYTAQSGDSEAHFTFAVTNIAKTNVVINWVRPSCGCTVAKLPPTPWTLTPGESGNIELTLDLKGKYGTLFKYVNVDTSAGQKMLNIRVTIPEGATIAGVDSRMRNMQLAMADRQIVFRGDCARCHSAPLAGKTSGRDLFAAGCAICHDTPNRATMVPDLAAVANPGTKDYWQLWIRHGKPGTLMPAFAQHQGGPLTEEQIDALAAHLVEKFPARAATVKAPTAVPALKPTAQVRTGVLRN